MKKEEIQISDLPRILFGDAPPIFMLEVFIRTLVVFCLLLLAMKLLGKRMTGELTLTEIAVMITLGGIIAVPMQMPDRGILQGLLTLILAIIFMRGVSYWAFKSKKFSTISQGKVHVLVKDGIIQLNTMKAIRMSQQQLFTVLRNKEITNLGEVKRLYMEACGMPNVIQYSGTCKGLPLYPKDDTELLETAAMINDQLACLQCGKLNPPTEHQCLNCGYDKFIQAIKSSSNE